MSSSYIFLIKEAFISVVFDTLQAAGAYRFRKMGAFASNHGIRSFVDGGEISACIWQGDLRCLVRMSSSSVTWDVGRLLWWQYKRQLESKMDW